MCGSVVTAGLAGRIATGLVAIRPALTAGMLPVAGVPAPAVPCRGDQRSQSAQYLACGIPASLVVAMTRPHCSHQPKRPIASRERAA